MSHFVICYYQAKALNNNDSYKQMHFHKQKLVHCGFDVGISAELPFILRSILLAFFQYLE